MRMSGVRLALWAVVLLSGTQQLVAQSWLDDYFARVARNQAEQPHWITPLITTTSRLDQKVRYDVSWQTRPDGRILENYGGSKGLEFIPANNVAVVINAPPYLAHNNTR